MMLKGSTMQSVVITGASTGIGWATAKLLLDRGFRVFGSVRKQADADRLKREFGANFTPLLFDVTDEAAVLAAAREVRAALNGETLRGRQERQSADVGLFGLQARDRRALRKPAARNDAVRHRCRHHRAGRGENADLEQGRGSRHFALQEFAVLPGAGANPQIHAAARRIRLAGRKDCGADR